MLKIGSHVSMTAPDYLVGSVNEALENGANALMLYTGAPQNSLRAPIEKLKIEQAINLWISNVYSLNEFVIHMPYIINLANTIKEGVFENSKEVLEKEINRSIAIGATNLVLHPGSSVKGDLKQSLDQISQGLNEVLANKENIVICLETMAGKGSELGKTFEELAYIISNVERKDLIGVCLDTCHIHDAGYNLSDFSRVLDEFDQVIGLDKLKVIHINDSKNVVGSHKDRHANIGQGEIGLENIMKVINEQRLDNIPMILETPYIDGKSPYKDEIALIRKHYMKQFS